MIEIIHSYHCKQVSLRNNFSLKIRFCVFFPSRSSTLFSGGSRMSAPADLSTKKDLTTVSAWRDTTSPHSWTMTSICPQALKSALNISLHLPSSFTWFSSYFTLCIWNPPPASFLLPPALHICFLKNTCSIYSSVYLSQFAQSPWSILPRPYSLLSSPTVGVWKWWF